MKKKKFYVDIIKWTIIVLIAALVFYCVCPKYDFHRVGIEGGIIANTITGELYYYSVEDEAVIKFDVDWMTMKQFRKEYNEKKLREEKEQLEDTNEQTKSRLKTFKEILEGYR